MLSLKITDLDKASWWFVIPIYVEPGLRVVHIELKTRLGALLTIVYLTGGLKGTIIKTMAPKRQRVERQKKEPGDLPNV